MNDFDLDTTLYDFMIKDLLASEDRCSILMQGSYKPVSGRLVKSIGNTIWLMNEYSEVVLDKRKIIRITRWF